MIVHNDFTSSVILSPLELTNASSLHGEMQRDNGVSMKVKAFICWRLEIKDDDGGHGSLYNDVSTAFYTVHVLI